MTPACHRHLTRSTMASSRYWVKHLFDKYDKDKSQSIDAAELGQLVYDCGLPASTDELKDIVLFLSPSNSKIDFETFFSWWTSEDRFRKLTPAEQSTMDEALQVFRAHDLDRSGTVRKDEFTPLANEMKVGMDTFDAIDVNGDGKISFNEFLDWFQRVSK
eukprot:TRINITY_DN16280_c0_g1_i1.p2 TRINITY_DN16280_c0_g1~~TRINITY_DN16280_c0_g1_i1.p2  ORF type:complete len:160 (+),score=45.14 TRINITY_DN16280_c0_g1_i1:520-999(+)